MSVDPCQEHGQNDFHAFEARVAAESPHAADDGIGACEREVQCEALQRVPLILTKRSAVDDLLDGNPVVGISQGSRPQVTSVAGETLRIVFCWACGMLSCSVQNAMTQD